MLFTPHLFAFRKDGLREKLTATSLGGQKLCLVPRGQCSFRRIKITGNNKKSLKAAEFRVRQEADLGENKFIIKPDDSGHYAGVWGFKSDSRHKGRYIPESLALSQQSEGVHLITLIDGFEGQVWDAGNIVASRWWAKKPDSKKWTTFLHSVQAKHDIDFVSLPSAKTLKYRTNFPIFKMDKERALDLFSPSKLGLLLVLGFGCGFLFLSGQYVRNKIELQTVSNEIEAISSVTAQISSDRRRALANSRAAQKYNILGHPGTFFLGLDDVATILDSKGLLIERISYDSGEMEIRLRSSQEIDIPDMVAKLESKPSLADVSIGLAPGNAILITAEAVSPYEYPLRRDSKEAAR